MDIAPGPEMQEADASPPFEQAKPETVPEQLEATPPQLTPEVVAPPEQKPDPTPPKPEPAKIVPEPAKPIPVPEKPKPVRKEAKKPTEAPPAPRTTAAPRAERQAPAASAISAGASAAAVASYNQMVAAHLQRFKQYPPAAKAAGQQGTSRLSFSISRSGQVLSSRARGIVGPRGARCRDAGDGPPRPAVSGVPAGYEAGLDEFQRADPVFGPLARELFPITEPAR